MARLTLATLVAALATLAQAVILTNSEFNLVAGQPFTIEWSEASGPVALRLKSGPEGNLVTVQEITSGQTGQSFTWLVPTNLQSGEYAFEIEDGAANINYSLRFPISGDGSAATGASSATGSAATSAGSGSASASATATETPSTAVSVTTVVSTATASGTASSSDHSASSTVTGAVSSSHHSHASTHSAIATNGTLTRTTVTQRPSATTTSNNDSEASRVPDSGASGSFGSAVFGAVVGLGALLMAY